MKGIISGLLLLFVIMLQSVWCDECEPLEKHTLPFSSKGIRIEKTHTQKLVTMSLYNIRLPYGVGVYVRSSPLDTTKKSLISNQFLDSGTAGVVRPRSRNSPLRALLFRKQAKSMFKNPRYYRMELLDGKCRTYNLHIEYPIDVYMDQCKQTFEEDDVGSGIEMKMKLYWGFVRPLSTKSSTYWEKDEHETEIVLYSGSHPATRHPNRRTVSTEPLMPENEKVDHLDPLRAANEL